MQRQMSSRFLSLIFLTLVFELSIALDFVDDNVTDTAISETSPFFSVSFYTSRFDQQVLLIDGAFCGPNDCFVSVLSILDERNSQCHQCRCTEDCFLYQDCCPSVSLNANIPYRKTETVCRQPGNKPSKHGHRYFMTTTCSAGNPPDLVYKCEESKDLDVDVQMPVIGFGPDGNIGNFKNIYCAECHGYDDTLLYYTTLIECINSSNVFTAPKSAIETINAALMTDDCSIDYQISGWECEVTDEEGFELIDSCNQTGLWGEYDELVLKGCLLKSYKIPVFDKYYNIFCFICNHYYTWGGIVFYLHYPQPCKDEKDCEDEQDCEYQHGCKDEHAREAEDYRLKGIIHDVFPENETSNETNSCFEIDDTEICRDLLCPNQLEFKEQYSKCEEKIITNAYGYEVCFIRETVESNPSKAALHLNEMINNMKKRLEDLAIVIKSSEKYDLEMWNCDGIVSFRVQTRFQLASLHLIYRSYFIALLDSILGGSVFKPLDKCGQVTTSSLEENCKVDAILNTGRRHDLSADNPMISLVRSVLYLPFSKLTECCQTRLNASEYDIDKFGLLTIITSQKILQEGDYVLDVNETVRVCFNDIVQLPYTSPCRNQETFYFYDDLIDETTPVYDDYSYDFTIPPEAIVYEDYTDNIIKGLFDSKTETPQSTTLGDSINRNTSNRLIMPLFLFHVNILCVIMYIF